MIDYLKPGELDPMPDSMASLYKTPWRSNPKTISAYDALNGVGIYYKHIPNDWTEQDHVNVMKQMAEAGTRRLRLAPHFAIYITKDWKCPTENELFGLRKELRASKSAGIRPCVIFVHIPPIGKAGARELQEWWRQGELMPAGEVGSSEFNAYLDKTYLALEFLLNEARSAGFTEADSYDLEMGQNLWWGAPACPRPFPSTTLDALRPGGRIYEFDLALIKRFRKDGFSEPTVWWGQTHHHFDLCNDSEVPQECVGRAISIYSAWSGTTTKGWLSNNLYDKPAGPNDMWPIRRPLKFMEGDPLELVLARPESWAGDYTRHDNLIALMQNSKTPVSITSLGTVPYEIPEVDKSNFSGWQLKQRGLTRSLAFWLNQGSSFVLLHSAYEPGSQLAGEMTHALIPHPIDPANHSVQTTFRWQNAPPLVALRSFCDGLNGAKPVKNLDNLKFRYSLNPDPALIGASGNGKALHASDLVAILPFQLDERSFSVAVYVMTPNIAESMPSLKMTLQVDKKVIGDVSALRPSDQTIGKVEIQKAEDSTTIKFDVHDDVTWIRLKIED